MVAEYASASCVHLGSAQSPTRSYTGGAEADIVVGAADVDDSKSPAVVVVVVGRRHPCADAGPVAFHRRPCCPHRRSRPSPSAQRNNLETSFRSEFADATTVSTTAPNAHPLVPRPTFYRSRRRPTGYSTASPRSSGGHPRSL